MSVATVNGAPAPTLRVQLSAAGLWFADAVLADAVALAELEEVEIAFADLALSGAVLSGGPWKGGARYRIVGGKGKWGSTIEAKDYVNDAGVTAKVVVREAALAAGEDFDLDTIPATILGRRWERAQGPAARVLDLVLVGGWYVGEDGVARAGSRPRTELTIAATSSRVELDAGIVELVGATSLAELVPGVVVEGLEALDVEHEVTAADGIRTILYGRRRTVDAWRRLIATALPDYRFRGGPFEYRVVSRAGERLNLQPVRSSLGLPGLRRVRVRPGLPGCRADTALGSTVLVSFVNAEAGGAVVVGFEDAEGAGFLPDELDLCKADGRVLREGDTLTLSGVQAGGGTTGVVATVTLGLGVPPEPSRVKA